MNGWLSSPLSHFRIIPTSKESNRLVDGFITYHVLRVPGIQVNIYPYPSNTLSMNHRIHTDTVSLAIRVPVSALVPLPAAPQLHHEWLDLGTKNPLLADQDIQRSRGPDAACRAIHPPATCLSIAAFAFRLFSLSRRPGAPF
jgi:hypothetical protein